LLYATGFVVPDPVVWFRAGGKSHLLVNPLELGRARRQARVDVVLDQAHERRRFEKKRGRAPKPFELVASLLRSRRVRTIRVPSPWPCSTTAASRSTRSSRPATSASIRTTRGRARSVPTRRSSSTCSRATRRRATSPT